MSIDGKHECRCGKICSGVGDHINCIAGNYADAWNNSKQVKENEEALMMVINKLTAERDALKAVLARILDCSKFVEGTCPKCVKEAKAALGETK